MSRIEDQTIALAGLLQAAYLVDRIARQGTCDEAALETSLNSLFVTSPDNTIEVYGSSHQLKVGLQRLSELLSKEARQGSSDWLRYSLSILHLEAKLRKNPPMLDAISKGLERAESPKVHFGLTHENTLASLADTYQKTISTFSLRIQVSGEPTHLKSERNAAKIRSLLLCGVRAAMLWRQVGGHRWHLLFKKSALANETKRLLA